MRGGLEIAPPPPVGRGLKLRQGETVKSLNMVVTPVHISRSSPIQNLWQISDPANPDLPGLDWIMNPAY